MDLDKQILDKLKASHGTSKYTIFIPEPPPLNFYYKHKLLHSTSSIAPLPKISFQPTEKPTEVFLTQVSGKKAKKQKSQFLKVFSTCLKEEIDREYSDVNQVANWLQGVKFLQPLSKMRMKLLGKKLNSKRYRRGEYLFCDNQPLHLIFIVLCGEVHVIKDGKRVETRSPRDVVGEHALIEQENSEMSARACTEAYTLHISVKFFMEILGSDQFKSSINIMRILRKIKLFANIPILQLLSLSNKLKPETIRKGTIIYSSNEIPNSFYVLTHGEVQENIVISKNFDQDRQIIRSGEYFGSRDLILAVPRRSSAVALTKSVVYTIPQVLFEEYNKVQKKKELDNDDLCTPLLPSASFSRQNSDLSFVGSPKFFHRHSHASSSSDQSLP